MGLWDKLKGELIDIIEWLQDGDDDVMVYRFERRGNEIKNGAQLTVRESQVGVFINEGQIADVFGPGRYELTTQNLPVLSTLKGWKYGFNSPFKAEVYFLNTKKFTNQKWGTPNEFAIYDDDYGSEVYIKSFGSYTMKIVDPVKFIKEVVGTDNEFTTEEIRDELRSIVVSRFIDAVGEASQNGITPGRFSSNFSDLAEFCQKKIGPELQEDYGLDMTKLLISSMTFDDDFKENRRLRAKMKATGVNSYSEMQNADAMRDAASNPGGGGGMEGMMGMAMMQQMMQQNRQQQQPYQQQYQQQQYAPPPPPPAVQYYAYINGQQQGPFDMNTLKQMIAQGQFSKETSVWKQGMSGWQPAGQVPDVAALFGAVPPPPPPPPPPM